MHVYIYSDSALHQTVYMMLIGYANYIILGVLVYAFVILTVYS